MAFKEYAVDGLPPVRIYKRRGSRSLRLSVMSNNTIRVTIPSWTAYATGLAFLKQRQSWVVSQLQPELLLHEGQPIGKAHRLYFRTADQQKITTRIRGTEIIINYPVHLDASDTSVQQAAERAAHKALKLQADQLLPQRLADLAAKHGYTYSNLSTRRLKSRWGSCDNKQAITLNIFLMQLPWDAIDYILLHELAHTRVMAHGPKFWQEMERVLPDAKQRRKQMKGFQPVLQAMSQSMA